MNERKRKKTLAFLNFINCRQCLFFHIYFFFVLGGNVAALDDMAPSHNNGYLWLRFICVFFFYLLRSHFFVDLKQIWVNQFNAIIASDSGRRIFYAILTYKIVRFRKVVAFQNRNDFLLAMLWMGFLKVVCVASKNIVAAGLHILIAYMPKWTCLLFFHSQTINWTNIRIKWSYWKFMTENIQNHRSSILCKNPVSLGWVCIGDRFVLLDFIGLVHKMH